MASDTLLVGDWNGDGRDDYGVRRGDRFYFDLNGNGDWDGVTGGDRLVQVGTSSDVPFVGDFDGDGTDDWGLRRGATYFRDGNSDGIYSGPAGGDLRTNFGSSLDVLLLGDWDGNGTIDLGVRRGSTIFRDGNSDGIYSGTAGGDLRTIFGIPSDQIIIGTWTTPLLATHSQVDNQASAASDGSVVFVALPALKQEDLAPIVVLPSITTWLGQSADTAIAIDDVAAGHGWFVDLTPYDNEAFDTACQEGLVAAGQLDLLTVEVHEISHVLGLNDIHSDINSCKIMNGRLNEGVRRLPTEGELAEILLGK